MEETCQSHPSTADPFQWTLSEHYEGDETSESIHPYLAVDLGPNVIEFRRFSVEYIALYIEQLPRVEYAWEFSRKAHRMRSQGKTWTLLVDQCDDLQVQLHDACRRQLPMCISLWPRV